MMNKTNYEKLQIPAAIASQLAADLFDKTAHEIKPLPGSEDFNFYLKTKTREEFILKISRPDTEKPTLDLQIELLQYLKDKTLSTTLPQPILSKNGTFLATYKDQYQQPRFVRMLTWVEGQLWAKTNPHSNRLLADFGTACAHLSLALKDFKHPAAHRFFSWNPSEWQWQKENASVFQEKEQDEIATYFLNLFTKDLLPIKDKLPKSIIHSDLNNYNVLVAGQAQKARIAGFIDFSDAIFSHTINEIATACAYALMDKADPLATALNIVGAYHQTFPLTALEISVLYHFIAARLLVSVLHSTISLQQEPDNKYLKISQQPAWDLLKKWKNINPHFAEYAFRATCGLAICPQQKQYKEWIKKEQHQFADVVNFEENDAIPLDLSVGSLDLGLNENFENTAKFNRKINDLLSKGKTAIGYGGYGEIRPIYTTDDYLVIGNQGPQWRTVHLGIDIWAKAGTPVFAPIAGKVFAQHNNIGDRNYGPTLILEHEMGQGLRFYTLYGHLGDDFTLGTHVKKGQQIGIIGAPPNNGNWPPHLHFQVILDMLAWKTDFPGVAFPNEKEIWLAICPNPITFFPRLQEKWTPKIHLPDAKIIEKRKTQLGKNLSLSYDQPLHIVRASGQYLYATDGRRYLDTVNNVPHIGHQHPKVVKAAQRQIAVLNTNTRYLHEQIIEYSDQLLATFPPELCVAYFVNSGSEANELAIRMAKTITNQKDIIAIEVGYHGNTNACVAVSSYKFDGKGGKGAPTTTHILPIPDDYRGTYLRGVENIGEKYAASLDDMLQKIQDEGRGIAGFIAESMLSCGGQIVLPENYLKTIYPKIRAAGGVCIADEVQVGFGRVGDTFWGFELQGVIPDIVVLGKPIGNGHPMGAVICTKAIADAFANGMEYFSTFGGNPVSCIIGKTVLEEVLAEKLQDHAKVIGTYLKTAFKNLQQQFPIIGDVRGHGLFLGIELVKNPKTKVPAADEAHYLVNRMRDYGILMSIDGPLHNVLKIKPPMCFNKENAIFLIHTLQKVLQEDFLNNSPSFL